MKKYILLVTISTLLLFTSSSTYAYQIVGTYSCGSLISLDKEDNRWARQQVIFWFQGYVTGRNYSAKKQVWSVPDQDSIYYYLLKFCKENPIRDTDDASLNLYNKLL